MTSPFLNANAIGGLYRPSFEKDNCGLGLVVDKNTKPSRRAIDVAIGSLCRLTHRGGLAFDQLTGDGSGLLITKPDDYFREIAQSLFDRQFSHLYAVGCVFFGQEKDQQRLGKQLLEDHLKQNQLIVVGWRNVPTDPTVLGQRARDCLPVIRQLFVEAPEAMSKGEFNRHLFSARRKAESMMAIQAPQDSLFHVASLHSNTISYKGLVLPADLPRFYSDLSDANFTSTMCSYHQRFSTNTLPEWRLAQPFRLLAHNGELNSIQGNRNWAQSRAKHYISGVLPNIADLGPIVSQQGSDSSTLDNMVEVLSMGGMSLVEAMRLLIPPAWENNHKFSQKEKAYFDFFSHHVEPWDGPASVMLHDGEVAVCALDRNGLRPLRYIETTDGLINFSSEIGVWDHPPETILRKGKLCPGDLVSVDTKRGEILESKDIIKHFSGKNNYEQWLKNCRVNLLAEDEYQLTPSLEETHQLQKYFNLSFEERDMVVRVLAEDSAEATSSMGDDIPLPPFSTRSRSLYDYFRQIFAQVTNPPIDSLREQIVMSLKTILGGEPNIFAPCEQQARRLELDAPVLSPQQMQAIKKQTILSLATISLHYDPKYSLTEALDHLCERCEHESNKGTAILHLSDSDIKPNQPTIHALMAVGTVHHHLITTGHRNQVNLLVETSTARDPHHFAVLLGYGATLIYPYLAYHTLAEMKESKELSDQFSLDTYCKQYLTGIHKGLLKIFSKIGISTVSSYRGSQLFEIVGLSNNVVNRCFTGTVNRIGGLSFKQIEQEFNAQGQKAFDPSVTIEQGGLIKFVYGGEEHAYSPPVVDLLRKALQTGDLKSYLAFAEMVNHRKPIVIRDFLKIKSTNTPISLSEVEPKEALFQRFDCAGISLGALSPEAHESIAIAMNSLHARSNSGEGGEDPTRFNSNKNSKIKQIASGRFGVTAAYLMSAEVVQIKIAQGAKPGEGGQLPGHKVDATIAKLRYAIPGVTLISPPPHHDIYSIEDLAQLIYDIKQLNPNLLVSVKLVSAPGVGTVAAGVVKAYADMITISGYDGGTGASPLTSVKYAGCPFELGLSEAQQVLRANGLRRAVRLQTDGGLKTGLDVIKAAILGAESFGFGTAPMIALGCKYLRLCHLNICPVGIATQKEKLRTEHYHGVPQMVVNYFEFLAEECREIMAHLGVRSLKELIGKTEYLEVTNKLEGRQTGLQLEDVLSNANVPDNEPRFCETERNPPWDKGELNEHILKTIQPAIDEQLGGVFNFSIQNTDRSVGARTAGYIAQKYGNQQMEPKPIIIHFKGIAGQSFGVWNVGGMHLYLQGDTNDYVGKSMSGGKLVITPPPNVLYVVHETPIMGNTCLYGSTGGKLFADGRAGERFAVRNSGATAITTGMGDHGCEYMTGGYVVSLGPVGSNFGAGMSGGCAMIYDPDDQCNQHMNHELVEALPLGDGQYHNQAEQLHKLIQEFVNETGSQHGKWLLSCFDETLQQCKLIKPKAMTMQALLQVAP